MRMAEPDWGSDASGTGEWQEKSPAGLVPAGLLNAQFYFWLISTRCGGASLGMACPPSPPPEGRFGSDTRGPERRVVERTGQPAPRARSVPAGTTIGCGGTAFFPGAGMEGDEFASCPARWCAAFW